MSYKKVLPSIFLLQSLSGMHAMHQERLLTPQERQWQRSEQLKLHLFKAIEKKDLDAVQFLLNQGADPNGCYNGVSPLYMALFGSGRDTKALLIAGVLLARKADPNEQSAWAPLLVQAASHGWWDVMALLLEHGAKINAQAYSTGKTALHVATEGGYWAVVNNLIEAGIDHVICDGYGKTALQVAQERSCTEIISILKDAPPKRP